MRGALEKGRVSNLASFTLLVAGVVADSQAAAGSAWSLAGPWMLTAGLFGFAGGITNWLAVKMLFDRVPLLWGSGVIPNRFREIRAAIKDLIMAHFFDEEYLRRFFSEQGGGLGGGPDLAERFAAFAESEEGREAIDREIDKLKEGPFGMMIRMAGNDILRALVVEFTTGLLAGIEPRLRKMIGSGIDIPALRARVDELLRAKLEELSPETVKRMMEEVIREHLGWLIVWGNLFGGAIGLLSRAAALKLGLRGTP